MEKRTCAAIFAVIAILFVSACAAAVCYHPGDSSQPERIGIIGAIDCEVDEIKNEMTVESTVTIAGMEFSVGRLGSCDIVVVECGVGKVNAGVCAQLLITNFNAKAIINTGVAGSVDDSLGIGDFVISTSVVQYDVDVSALGYDKGVIPGIGFAAFTADAALREKAVAAVKESAPDAKVVEGCICTGDQYLSLEEQKQAAEPFGGLCCEMEGGAIAQVCYLNNVPFVVIRAISDNSDGSEYIEHRDEIALESAHAVIYMIESL